MNIIPAILPKTRDELMQKLQLLSDAGFFGRVQIDMCDGKYVESKTWPFDNDPTHTPTSIELMMQIKNDIELQQLLSHFEIDVDLMVMDSPENMMVWNTFNPKRKIIHIDSLTDTETLQILLSQDPEHFNSENLIFACSFDTDIEKFDYWYNNFNMRNIQVMGIEHIGKQGEEFSERTFDLIKNLQSRYAALDIIVDGGVSISSIKRLSEYGISGAVAGSAVFKNNTIKQNLADLQSVL